jgi:hypothetical protein
MPYTRSVHRKEFEARLGYLASECLLAEKLGAGHPNIRDMVFQCAIFQTSAAMETYLRLLIESWVQALKTQAKGLSLPAVSRGFLATKRFESYFARYAFNKDEAKISADIPNEHQQWPILNPQPALPPHLDGKAFHDQTAYPSFKNIKRLFRRVGIAKPEAELNKYLKGDVETLIEGFQSVRTAIAHSSPPPLTVKDVKKLLNDNIKLVRCIDRMFFRHVIAHGGQSCWDLTVWPSTLSNPPETA